MYQVKLGRCQNINTSRGFSALASTPGAFGNTGRASDSRQIINTSRGFSALASTNGAFGNTGRAVCSCHALLPQGRVRHWQPSVALQPQQLVKRCPDHYFCLIKSPGSKARRKLAVRHQGYPLTRQRPQSTIRTSQRGVRYSSIST